MFRIDDVAVLMLSWTSVAAACTVTTTDGDGSGSNGDVADDTTGGEDTTGTGTTGTETTGTTGTDSTGTTGTETTGTTGTNTSDSETTSGEGHPACVAACDVEQECDQFAGSLEACIQDCEWDIDGAEYYGFSCQSAWEDLYYCVGGLTCEEWAEYDNPSDYPYPCSDAEESIDSNCEGQ